MCDTRHFKQQTVLNKFENAGKIISAPPHSIKLSKGNQVLLDLPVDTRRKPAARAALARSAARLPQDNKKKLALPHNKKSGGKDGVSNSVKSISGMMANRPVVSKDFLSLNRTTDLDLITPSQLQSASSHLRNSTDLESEVDAVNLSGRVSDDDASVPATVARDGDSDMSVSSAFCRICHGGGSASSSAHDLGSLSSPCDCRGTVAMVHISCLERWLSESGKSTCELCGYHYDTRRVHKHGAMLSLFLWITSVNYNQFVLDVMATVAMTPFAVFSAYVIGQSLGVLIHHATQETPWLIATTFIFGCLTLIGYYCWIISAATRNAVGWWLWHRTNYDVHLIRPDSEVPSAISPSKSTASIEAIGRRLATRPPSSSDRG